MDSSAAEKGEPVRLAMMESRKKPKMSNFVRKLADAKRSFAKKFSNEKPERSALTMFDLIYYNPSSNPMPSVNEASQTFSAPVPSSDLNESKLAEEDVDQPDEVDAASNAEDDDAELKMPVPQVKIGANGEIILDEKSLLIETTEAKKGREALLKSVPVFEGNNRKVSYYGRKGPHMMEWTPLETKCFYKALNTIGTDFALMEPLFAGRTRGQLKNKFKREERLNPSLIESALSRPGQFNITCLKEELDNERALVAAEKNKKQEECVKLMKELKTRPRKKLSETKENVKIAAENCEPPTKDSLAPVEKEKRERPIRKAAQRRKLDADFVDPNEVDENDICTSNSKFKKSRTSTVYSPVVFTETDNSCDTLSECGVEKTETITNQEFIHLLNKNLENLQQSTIKVQIPTKFSSDGGQCNPTIQMVIEQEEDIRPTYQNIEKSEKTSLKRVSVIRRRDNTEQIVIIKNTPKIRAEESHVETNESITDNNQSESCLDTVKSLDDDTLHDRADPASGVSSDHDEKVIHNRADNSELNRQQDSAVAHCSQNPATGVSSDHDEEVIHNRADNSESNQQEGSAFLHYSRNSAVAHYSRNPANGDYSHHDMNVLHNQADNSESNQQEDSAVAHYSGDPANGANSDHETISDSQSSGYATESYNEGMASAEPAMNSRDVEFKSCGGFKYAVMETGGDEEDKRTFLSGLQPGSFVFMSTEGSDHPLEKRCSMFMIVENIDSSGNRVLTPMPVKLPAELMNHIVSELDGIVVDNNTSAS